ncbi:ricin-type beta-trefoil lectin domain protein [Streptomyces sp. NPDC001070]
MTASPGDPTAADGVTREARSPGGTPLPRRTRRTSAIADASATTSATPTDWNDGRPLTKRARLAAALPEPPGDTSAGTDSAYADGFAAGLAFAARSAAAPGEGDIPDPDSDPDAKAEGADRGTRPRRSRWALPAGAVLAAGLLVSLPFLVRGGGQDDRDAAPVTLSGITPSGGIPGAGAATASPSDVTSPSAARTPRQSPAGGSKDGGTPSPGASGSTATPGTKGGGAAERPSTGPSHSGGAPGVAIRSHASGRCIDGSTPWGTPLQVWDCTGSAQQSWQIEPDGSIRSMGKCMDVEGGSRDDGAAVQLADCNGTGAQKFRLNAAHDLVNLQADKCVEAEDTPGVNGTRLRLWSCTGADNQKWSGG